jgi:hypothetical protein
MANVYIYQRHIPEERIPGKPLGRHYHYDSRNELYPFRPFRGTRELAPVKWTRHIPILDQGNLGSCTGNALTGCLGSSPVYDSLPSGHPALDEALAVKIYSLATTLDSEPGSYPPTDTGSDGISASKAAQKFGLISNYTHCTDLPTMQQAMMQQSTAIGINWYSSFDAPDSSGLVSISSNAYVRGGHEVEVIGMDPTTNRFLAANSWGTNYGANGYFQFSFATMERLLSEQGDCTVPLALSTPPTPPPGPAPTPEPAALPREIALNDVAGPWAAQRRTRPDLVELQNAIKAWEAEAGL